MESPEFDLRGRDFVANPYPTYRRMRELAPVWREPHTGHIFVTRYADVVAVLKDPSFSSNRIHDRMKRVPPDVDASRLVDLLVDRLVMTDGERHRDLRREVGSAFTAARVRTYARPANAMIAETFDQLSARTTLDILNDVALPVPSRVILSVLGLPPRDHQRLREWAEDFYLWLAHSPGDIATRSRRAVASIEAMSEYVDTELDALPAEGGDSYLATMATNVAAGSMTRTEVIANLIGVINAAHETTTGLIANGTITLLEHPRELQRLIHDPGLIPSAVEEMLRYESPSQIISRIATEETDIGGVLIRPGDMLALVLGSANRDESVFPHPDEFDVTRRGKQHLAFGHGSHFCTGGGLASLEVVAIFRLLVPLLPRASIVGGPVRWRPTPAFRSPLGLVIDLDPVAITIAEYGGDWWDQAPTAG